MGLEQVCDVAPVSRGVHDSWEEQKEGAMPAEAAVSMGQWMEGTWPKAGVAPWPTLGNAHFFALFVPGTYFLKSSDPVHLPTVKARVSYALSRRMGPVQRSIKKLPIPAPCEGIFCLAKPPTSLPPAPAALSSLQKGLFPGGS